MKTNNINTKYLYTFIVVIILIGAVIIMYYLTKSSFNINDSQIEKIEINAESILIGDYQLIIEDEEGIKRIVKSLNNIACYPTNDMVGESSPHMRINFYERNNKRIITLYYYGGMVSISYYGINGDIVDGTIYETGLLTTVQLRRLCKVLSN